MMMTTTSTKTKLAIERKTDKALLKYGRMAENRQSESVAYFMRMRCMVDRETVASFFFLSGIHSFSYSILHSKHWIVQFPVRMRWKEQRVI